VATLWPLPTNHEVRLRVHGHSSMPIAIPCQAEDTRDHTFTLTPMAADRIAPSTRLRGRLVDSLGAPLANVRLVGAYQGEYGDATTTDVDGRFEFSVPVRDGVLVAVALQAADWRLGGDRVQLAADGLSWWSLRANATQELQLHATAATCVRGVLQRPDGTPFGAARVDLRMLAPGNDAGGVTVRSASDAAGRIELAGLPTGSYRLTASGSCLQGTVEVTTKVGTPGIVGKLTFAPNGEIIGGVTDAAGEPAPGTQVIIYGASARKLPRGLRPQTGEAPTGIVLTDRRGHFRIPRIADGDWALVPRNPAAPRAKQPEPVQLKVDAGTRHEVDLRTER
jgi:hypothetical protein